MPARRRTVRRTVPTRRSTPPSPRFPVTSATPALGASTRRGEDGAEHLALAQPTVIGDRLDANTHAVAARSTLAVAGVSGPRSRRLGGGRA
jgi:hypothetical protein